MLACDFLTVETVWLTRIYVLFFVSLERVGFRYSSGWVGALDRSAPERRWSVVSRFEWS
jgi:hypothetical protein